MPLQVKISRMREKMSLKKGKGTTLGQIDLVDSYLVSTEDTIGLDDNESQ